MAPKTLVGRVGRHIDLDALNNGKLNRLIRGFGRSDNETVPEYFVKSCEELRVLLAKHEEANTLYKAVPPKDLKTVNDLLEIVSRYFSVVIELADHDQDVFGYKPRRG